MSVRFSRIAQKRAHKQGVGVFVYFHSSFDPHRHSRLVRPGSGYGGVD